MLFQHKINQRAFDKKCVFYFEIKQTKAEIDKLLGLDSRLKYIYNNFRLSTKNLSIDELFEYAIETALKTNIVQKGDRVIITGASAVGNAVTDTIKLHIL